MSPSGRACGELSQECEANKMSANYGLPPRETQVFTAPSVFTQGRRGWGVGGDRKRERVPKGKPLPFLAGKKHIF